MRVTKDLNPWVSGFDGRAANVSLFRVVLLLRASASAMPPSGPSLLLPKLCTQQKERVGREQVPRAVGPSIEQANPSALVPA